MSERNPKRETKKSLAEKAFKNAWDKFGLEGSDLTSEHLWHPTRKWRFDFAFPSLKVAIEIEGRGRHQTIAGYRADCEKYNAAATQGWVIFRYPATDIARRTQYGESCLELFIEMVVDFLCRRVSPVLVNYHQKNKFGLPIR